MTCSRGLGIRHVSEAARAKAELERTYEEVLDVARVIHAAVELVGLAAVVDANLRTVC